MQNQTSKPNVNPNLPKDSADRARAQDADLETQAQDLRARFMGELDRAPQDQRAPIQTKLRELDEAIASAKAARSRLQELAQRNAQPVAAPTQDIGPR